MDQNQACPLCGDSGVSGGGTLAVYYCPNCGHLGVPPLWKDAPELGVRSNLEPFAKLAPICGRQTKWWPVGNPDIVTVVVNGRLRWRRYGDDNVYADFDTFDRAKSPNLEEVKLLNLTLRQKPRLVVKTLSNEVLKINVDTGELDFHAANMTVKVICPQCRAPNTVTIGQMQREETVTCAKCDADIRLVDRNKTVDKAVSRVNDAVDGLKKALEDLGGQSRCQQ